MDNSNPKAPKPQQPNPILDAIRADHEITKETDKFIEMKLEGGAIRRDYK